MRSFFCLSLLFYQRLFLSQDRCDNRSNGVDIRFCSHKSKPIYLCISHKQLDTTRKMQKEKRPSHIYFVRRSQPLSLLRRQLPYRGEPLAKRAGFAECQGLSSIGATTTTAASGGNRESLLGPRPARRKQSAADAGCRNPGSGTAVAVTERFIFSQQCPNPQLGQWHSAQPRQRPPSPRRAISSAVMASSASRRGSSRSKMVRLAYMTQPGRPQTGTPSR